MPYYLNHRKRKIPADSKDRLEIKEYGYKFEPAATTPDEDFERLKIKESFKPDHEKYRKFYSENQKNALGLLRELYQKLGWNIDQITFLQNKNEHMEKVFYILENKIIAPRSNYYYHGTSSGYYHSIIENGLNNRFGSQIHKGVIAPVEQGTTYISSYHDAWEFAEDRATEDKGIPIVVRWHSDKPLIKGEPGVTQQPVARERLEFCLDREGEVWYSTIPENLLTTGKKFRT